MDTLRLVDPAAREIVTSIAPFDRATQTAYDHRGFVAGLYTPPGGAPPLSGEVRLIAGGPGQPPVRVLVYRPAAAVSAAPAILYFHGGGLTAGSPDMMDAAHRQLAEDNGAVVVAVTYRLAPETPFPGAVEDGCAALDWLFNQAAALGVDTDRIALMGHSAGGGLAAATALLARDRGRRRPAAQILVYPMLDPRTGTPDAVADNPFTGQFMWTRAANRFGGTRCVAARISRPNSWAGSARPSPPPWRGCPRPSSPWAPSICFLRRTPPSPCVWRRRACPSSCTSTRAGCTASTPRPAEWPSSSPPT